MSAEDEPVQFSIQPRLTRSVEIATAYLAECVDQQLGCKHGKTAFYWALISQIQLHAKDEGAK